MHSFDAWIECSSDLFFLKKPDFLLSFLEKLLNSSFSEFACVDKNKCPEYQLIQLAKKMHKLSGTKSPL